MSLCCLTFPELALARFDTSDLHGVVVMHNVFASQSGMPFLLAQNTSSVTVVNNAYNAAMPLFIWNGLEIRSLSVGFFVFLNLLCGSVDST
jgi:hypothetical protein